MFYHSFLSKKMSSSWSIPTLPRRFFANNQEFAKAQREEPDIGALNCLKHQKTLLRILEPYVNEKGHGILANEYFDVCFEFFKITGKVVRGESSGASGVLGKIFYDLK